MRTEAMTDPRVASAFGRAATQYAEHAIVQHQAADRLLGGLVWPDSHADVLDIGCGPGDETRRLMQSRQSGLTIGLDISAGMLEQARSNQSSSHTAWLQADMQALPLRSNSLDLVFSNFAFQWAQNPAQLFEEVSRVLKPQGKLAFTTLLSGSLRELAEAWKSVDDASHVNRFHEAAEISALVRRAGFRGREETRLHQQFFPDPKAALRSLKIIGANTVRSESRRGMTGRRQLQKMLEAYESVRGSEGVPMSYQVFYGWFVKGD